jgi:hypothetical protein
LKTDNKQKQNKMKSLETVEQLISEFGDYYGMSFFMIDVDINIKNIRKAHELISNGYSPDEIKNKLFYQNFFNGKK